MYTTKKYLGYYANVYLYVITTMHILYALIFIGLIQYNIEFIHYVHYFIQIFIGVFLIARFHPFRQHTMTELDVHIIFSSAIFLLTNIGIIELFVKHFNKTTIGKVANTSVDNIITKLPVDEIREKSVIPL
jgi:hypothetical protein